jgi:hypothetical protein
MVSEICMSLPPVRKACNMGLALAPVVSIEPAGDAF